MTALKQIYINSTLNGAGTRIRTKDFLITNEALYQLSYTGSYTRSNFW